MISGSLEWYQNVFYMEPNTKTLMSKYLISLPCIIGRCSNRVWRSLSTDRYCVILKLYCGYLYTRPCMINRIWGIKQLWLQVNGHAWFHLHGIHLPVRNGAEGAKNSKWKYLSPAGFEPTPRHDTTSGTAL